MCSGIAGPVRQTTYSLNLAHGVQRSVAQLLLMEAQSIETIETIEIAQKAHALVAPKLSGSGAVSIELPITSACVLELPTDEVLSVTFAAFATTQLPDAPRQLLQLVEEAVEAVRLNVLAESLKYCTLKLAQLPAYLALFQEDTLAAVLNLMWANVLDSEVCCTHLLHPAHSLACAVTGLTQVG